MKHLHTQRGITLIEMLAGMAIMSAVAAALFQLMAGQLRQVSRQEAKVERRQEGRAALAVLARELRLAGFPATPDPACHAMRLGVEVEPAAVRFLANLYGVATTLAAPASAGDTRLEISDDDQIRNSGLPASPGSAFAPNDAIYLHDPRYADDASDDRIECHRLDRAGRSGRISLAAGDAVRHVFPVGSRVQVVNLVRYAHAPATRQLVRSVDGASQSVADHVAAVHFARQAGRVTVEIIVEPDSRWQMTVALRNNSNDWHE